MAFLLAVTAMAGGCRANRPEADEPGAGRPPEPTMLLLIADGGAAREVRGRGLAAGLSEYLGEQSVLVWPAMPPVQGRQAIVNALGRMPTLQGAHAFWQPLAAHGSSGLGLTFGVFSVADSTDPSADSPRLGRYLAAWRPQAQGWRLEMFFVGGMSLPWVDSIAPTMNEGGPTRLPGGLEAADSTLRAELSEGDAPGRVLARWSAPTGMTFNGSGILNIGPEGIEAALSSVPAGMRWEMHREAAGGAVDSSLAWVVGNLRITVPVDGEVRTTNWNYALFWVRQSDGSYKLAVAATNLRFPPRAAP